MGHVLCKNRYSHIALCCGYTFIIRNHRIDSTSQVQAYYHYHDHRAGKLIGLKVDVSGEFITDFELVFVQGPKKKNHLAGIRRCCHHA